MALPNTNISVAMVKAELGAATNDVGQLCIHPNVNKWSKWKPVRHQSVEGMTEAKLSEANYGLGVFRGSPPLTLSEFCNSLRLNDGVIYYPPQGGNLSPFRLGDFRNYNKDAQIPMGTGVPLAYTQILYVGDLTSPTTITFSLYNFAGSDLKFSELYQNEIAQSDNLYLGARLVNTNRAQAIYKADNLPLDVAQIDAGQAELIVTFNWTDIGQGTTLHQWQTGETVEVTFFITNYDIPQTTGPYLGWPDLFYAGIPSDNQNSNPHSYILNVAENPNLDLTVGASWYPTTGQPTVWFSVTFQSVQGVQVSGAVIQFASDPNFTNIVQNEILGSFYLEGSRTINRYNIYLPMNTLLYWKIVSNNKTFQTGTLTLT